MAFSISYLYTIQDRYSSKLAKLKKHEQMWKMTYLVFGIKGQKALKSAEKVNVTLAPNEKGRRFLIARQLAKQHVRAYWQYANARVRRVQHQSTGSTVSQKEIRKLNIIHDDARGKMENFGLI